MSELKIGQYRRLSEAYEAWLREAGSIGDFPILLKDGLRAMFFSEFAGIPTEWDRLVTVVPSNQPYETWIKNQGVGTLPKVGEGAPYQRLLNPDMKPEVVIGNDKRGGILEITEEMLRFDKYGVIQSNVRDLASAAAQTREEAVFTVLTTTGNYTATTSDNLIGNNTSTNGLSPANFITAYTTLTTMFDRGSGRPLGVKPDTLVVTPDLAFFARQLFLSPTIGGAAGSHGSTDTDLEYGQGQRNPFFGLIRNLIVSYWLRSKGTQYAWILCQAKKGIVLQEVEPLQLLSAKEDPMNESYIERDVFRYRVRDWFGVGFVDDRYAYYANSTTAPAVS